MSCNLRTRLIVGFILFLLILCPGPTDCKSLTVCKEGCNFLSVKAAVEAADPGDVVEVESGIYKENVRINKSLTLIGKDTGAGKPVIDAGGNGSAATILADGITLDGFNLTNALDSQADFYAGIRVWANDSIIKNNLAFYNENGILMTNSFNGTLEKNDLITNKYGMRIETSRNITVDKNEMRDNQYGLLMESSNGNLLRSNIAEDNDFGMKLNHSENNTLIDNQMRGNNYNFGAEGYNNISAGNLVNSRPIIYLIAARNKTIDSSANIGTLYCFDCENVTIRGLNLSNNFHGIYLQNSTGSVVEKNNLRNSVIGISLINSYTNLVSENMIGQSRTDGLEIIDSDRNQIENNRIEDYGTGLHILRSAYNEIQGNKLLNGSTGVHLDSSWSNGITANLISINDIGLKTESTEKNIISLNNMTNNSLDIRRMQFDNDTLENISTKPEVILMATAGVDKGKIRIKIDSYPPDADLLIDGKHIKNFKTPDDYPFPGLGKYDVELRLPGERRSKEVILEEGTEPEPVFINFET
jgi:parallel beta-helix repeat protein